LTYLVATIHKLSEQTAYRHLESANMREMTAIGQKDEHEQCVAAILAKFALQK
jgi:hypothetical protein